MPRFLTLVLVVGFTPVLSAADGAGGDTRYAADFSQKHAQYDLKESDKQWALSLKRKLKETVPIIYFTRTDLLLTRDGVERQGLIYRRVDRPEWYYIPDCDVILDFQHGKIFCPSGLMGVVMRSPKTQAFIVCFNLRDDGYRLGEHSKIEHAEIWWLGNSSYNRLEHQ